MNLFIEKTEAIIRSKAFTDNPRITPKRVEEIFGPIRKQNEAIDKARKIDPQKLHEPFTI